MGDHLYTSILLIYSVNILDLLRDSATYPYWIRITVAVNRTMHLNRIMLKRSQYGPCTLLHTIYSAFEYSR